MISQCYSSRPPTSCILRTERLRYTFFDTLFPRGGRRSSGRHDRIFLYPCKKGGQRMAHQTTSISIRDLQPDVRTTSRQVQAEFFQGALATNFSTRTTGFSGMRPQAGIGVVRVGVYSDHCSSPCGSDYGCHTAQPCGLTTDCTFTCYTDGC